MLTQDQILNKIKSDLNTLAIELGYVDDEERPLYYFHGEVSTYDNYDWIKSIETYNMEIKNLKYLSIIPFALIRDASNPSNGEKIMERLDEYAFYAYIKTSQIDGVRDLLEEYMFRENMTNNLVEIEGSNVLKHFSNFAIDDEELLGAPDGESRHQVTLMFTYDIFESSLTSSKDYVLKIDGEEIKYLSWRFEKANMVIANNQNSPSGTQITNVNKLHEITMVCELYLDKNSAAIQKIKDDLTSQTRTNTSYEVDLTSDGTTFLKTSMILNGGKTTDTPPQINTMEVTFALSYERLNIRLGLYDRPEQLLEPLPVVNYKIGHAAALYTATYFGDNASRSKVVGLAKGFMITIPIMTSGSTLMTSLLDEVLGKVYTNVYTLEVTYLGVVKLFNVVLNDSAIESTDAAYDIISLVFVEAK